MNKLQKVFPITLILLMLINCEYLKPKSEGELLAEKHCQSCHLLSEPEDIDRATWRGKILQDMFDRLPPNSITTEEINKITEYYTSNAPLTMPIDKKRKRATIDSSLFHVSIPDFATHKPYTTLVKINEKSSLSITAMPKTAICMC